ncbi:MAG: glycosyltransferase family 39 protein [Alphaproteobacteria bacterium]|nr:glycosyltransferase family 39 protein [Alphaproteobacteria bacterium]
MSETFSEPRFGAPRERRSVANPGNGLVRMLDFVASSHRRAVSFLILCGLLLFLPGFFTIPPIDRDEARFAQAAKQMVESGDYVDIRFQDVVRYKKPVGIYWLQAAAVKTASALGLSGAPLRIWVYRLPSLGGAIGAVLLTYWAALAFVARRGAVLAALMICASVVLGVEARLAKTDAALLFTAVAVMGAMARFYLPWQRGENAPLRWTTPAIFWTAMAASILLKGPLILMFVGLAIAVLWAVDRDAAWLKRARALWGVPLLLVLVLPWFIAIFWRSGWDFFTNSVGSDMLSKISAQESHGAPPGYYLLLLWVTFWPGVVLTAMAVPAIWRARREPATQFLLAWLVPSWVVFEAVFTKLPHYVLPLYPAIAILTAGVMERQALARSAWMARGSAWWFVIPLLGSIIAVVGAVMLMRQPAFLAWPFIAAGLIFGLVAWWLYDSDHAERSLLNALVAAFMLAIVVYSVVLPSLTPVFPSAEVARALRRVSCVSPKSAAAGYTEPSLVFMAGTSTLLTDGAGAAEFLNQGNCRFAIVDRSMERNFAQRAEAIGLRYNMAARVEGYNYSQGRIIAISIFRSEGTE